MFSILMIDVAKDRQRELHRRANVRNEAGEASLARPSTGWRVSQLTSLLAASRRGGLRRKTQGVELAQVTSLAARPELDSAAGRYPECDAAAG